LDKLAELNAQIAAEDKRVAAEIAAAETVEQSRN
jgi:hypothetical protein